MYLAHSSMSTSNSSHSGTGDQRGTQVWSSSDASILSVIIADTVVTIVISVVLTLCVMSSISRRRNQREERDKLVRIIKEEYWANEENIRRAMQILTKMKTSYLFKGVSELHVFAYKYRLEWSHPIRQDFPSTIDSHKFGSGFSLLHTVKKIERLFETLIFQLPFQGTCPENISLTWGPTIFNLAHTTLLLWRDRNAKVIRDVVHYFAGKSALAKLEGCTMTDDDMEALVLRLVPYVNQLHLFEDHFLLDDVEIKDNQNRDMKNKIRYIDTALTVGRTVLESKETSLISAYYQARELASKKGILQTKFLPEIAIGNGNQINHEECAIYLRHIIRVICIPKSMDKIRNEEQFFTFLMQLYKTLYIQPDTGCMVEIIDRVRHKIVSCLKGMSTEHILMDKELTKAKLELMEKELSEHLSYLIKKQIQQQKTRKHWEDSNSCMDSFPNALVSPAVQYLSIKGDRSENETDHQSMMSGSTMYATAMSITSRESGIPLIAHSMTTDVSSDHVQEFEGISEDFYETSV